VRLEIALARGREHWDDAGMVDEPQGAAVGLGLSARFERSFRRWAARVRTRQLLQVTLTGAAVGLLLGAATATVLWKIRQGPWRPVASALGLVGAATGAFIARRRRFDDEAVALYLDGRLGSSEVITTAMSFRQVSTERRSPSSLDRSDAERLPGALTLSLPPATSVSTEVIFGRASALLEGADTKRVRPPVLVPLHALLPVGAGALVFVSLLALPPAPIVKAPPGMEKVTLADVRGLEKVAELGAMSARDDEQKNRLEKVADDARKLQQRLRDGVERREAQSEIAKLQDAIAAEKLSLGEGERRRGLEAALARLAEDPLTKDAAKALGDRDLVKFDEEMQKLANSREKADRDQAKKALEEAAAAAKKAGANDVAKALEDQKKLLEDRGKRADELRELGKALEGALSEDDMDALREFGHQKSDKSAQSAAKALGEALKKLTPEERKRLAEKLKKKLADQGVGAPGEGNAMKDLAKDLETEEGRKRLEDELRRLANEDDKDAEAERQKRLAEAEKGLGQPGPPGGTPPPAPGGKGPGDPGPGAGGPPGGGSPIPLPMPGAGAGSGPPKGGKAGDGSGGPGHSEDTGTGDHKGQSKEVAGGDLRARASAKMNGAEPNAGVTIGRAAGKEGDTANIQGSGAIGRAGPDEVSGIEKSDVPEEYREQVGRYFQP
jgi:hypothetical protein